MIASRVSAAAGRLTEAETRVVELVLAEPSQVAFGTVASLARAAGTSGPTVVRLATKLGFEGFVGMQAAVQAELSQQLRPAAERIRARRPANAFERSVAAAEDNVRSTFASVDPRTFDEAVRLLSNRRSSLYVIAGESTAGVAAQFVDSLSLLRSSVQQVRGSVIAVARSLAFVEEGDVTIAVEVRRYESWVVDAIADARSRGATGVAITDSALSPLARGADVVFTVAAEGPGPFDSHVGTLALLDALVAGVADRLRASTSTVARIDSVEAAVASHLQD
ncbi:MAG: MurR/RpiR family transcriptional regulator [Acidimicrobiia bacterium]